MIEWIFGQSKDIYAINFDINGWKVISPETSAIRFQRKLDSLESVQKIGHLIPVGNNLLF